MPVYWNSLLGFCRREDRVAQFEYVRHVLVEIWDTSVFYLGYPTYEVQWL